MKGEMQKKGNNQTTIILAGAVILLLVIFAFLLMTKNNTDYIPNNQPVVSSQAASGRIIQRGNLTKTADGSWNLLYDKPGAPATVARLVMGPDVFCKKSGKPILCSQLQNGHRVDVSGNLENNTLVAKEIDLLDEITIQPAPAANPQVQEQVQQEQAPTTNTKKTAE